MEMESSRRPSFDRSRELGLKRPRIAEEPSINNRPFQQKQQRPANAGAVISAPSSRFRVNNDRERDSDESVRGPYQQSNQLQQHQELISQYKAALAELTFNSKPIITNLTIIAGENTHAAKGIAATICANIVEIHWGSLRDRFPLHPTGCIKVPSDQKLPSLYLLDSIVKNIGRDYIKYFSARLPEVFCKAYRQVDGSTHSSMQHLFGTWKGVFPAQSLQIIERELGFLAAANGSSSTSTTSRADAQTQRQPHSIHVNPKYLEARRLQQTSRSVQHPQREELLDSGREKSLGAESEDHEYGPGLSRHITSRLGKPGERITDHSFDKQWSSTGRGVEESISSQRNGINARQTTPNHMPSRSANVHFPPSQNVSSRSSRELPRNWKNSEEEEYMWDDLNPGVADHVAVDNLQKDHWTADGPDKLEFGGRNTNRLHQADTGSRIDRDTDYLSSEQVPFGRQRSSSWQLQEPLVQGSDIPLPRTGLPHLGSTHAGTSSFDLPTVAASGPTGSLGKRLPSSGKPLISQHSSRDPRLNIAEKEQAQGNSLSQPNRKPASHSRSSDTHQNLLLDNIKKSEPQILQKITASSVSTFRSKQYNPSVQQVPLGQSEAEPSVGQLNTSALLAAVMKSGIPPGLLTEAAQPSLPIGPSQSSKFKSSSSSPLDLLSLLSKRKTDEPPPSSGPPPSSSSLTSTVTSDGSSSSSNPFSSLINTLMAKGFISASKSESETPASPPLSSKNLDQSPITTSTEVPTVSVPSAIPSSITDDKLTLSQKNAHKTTSSKPSHVSPQTVKTEIESLIGFEFRPDVLRQLHSSVVDGLFEDLPHSCSTCGLRLKLKERLERHLEWHALKQSESEKSSRKWFANSEDWVAGKTALEASEEDHEPMVPADESHCVCLLCGELFEDFYSLEREEWMFKGAVYMTISSESGSRASSSQTTGHDIIVHEKCMADDSVHDLEQPNFAKMEIDA